MLATLIITAAFVTGDTLSHTIRSLVIEELGPMDEVVRIRTRSGSTRAGSQSSYFSLSRYKDLAEELGDDPLIDAIVPGIREALPVINTTRRQSIRSLAIIGLRPEDASLVLPLDERMDEDGELLLEALEGRQLYLNLETGWNSMSDRHQRFSL